MRREMPLGPLLAPLRCGLSRVTRNAWLGLLVFSLQIEIAIGIETGSIDVLFFSNLVSSSIQTVEHGRHTIEFRLAPDFGYVQRDRLPAAKPRVPCRGLNAVRPLGFLVNPRDIADR